MNHKKIQRLWREERPRVPQRRRRKRHGSSTAPDSVVADAPNRVWAVDFQFDVTTISLIQDQVDRKVELTAAYDARMTRRVCDWLRRSVWLRAVSAGC